MNNQHILKRRCEGWGRQQSDEFEFLNNSRVKTMFDNKNTVISVPNFNKSINKAYKKYFTGKKIVLDYNKQTTKYNRTYVKFMEELSIIYGGEITIRESMVTNYSSYNPEYVDNNKCLIIMFEPFKKRSGKYLQYLEGEF